MAGAVCMWSIVTFVGVNGNCGLQNAPRLNPHNLPEPYAPHAKSHVVAYVALVLCFLSSLCTVQIERAGYLQFYVRGGVSIPPISPVGRPASFTFVV